MIWNIIISILLIIILHTLWDYIKDTFTLKKKKYINNEVDKYRQIMQEYSFSTSKPDDFSSIEKDLELFLQNNIEVL
jgi:hypothetical protein